ncbi:MAG: phosphoglucosamine mutase [Clostridia bacterium]
MELFQDYLGINMADYDIKNYNLKDIESVEALTKKIRLEIIKKHIDKGVIFKNLENIFIDVNVIIGKGTVIFSDNHLRGNTVIGKDCLLESGNILENATIGNNVQITKSIIKNSKVGNNTTVGPNAHIHTNSVVERDCRVGNFVEIKNSTIGINTKAAHLAYVGDTDIGNQCNIGCGSIFVNYDGKNKHRSYIGDSVFIGSNSNIIAPVKIEDNAYIAAGTTVTVDLPKNCMCIGRNRETIKENRSKYRKGDYQKKYFGTDGIRGIYGEFLTDNIAFLCGNFLGYSSNCGKIVVGRDNRVSGEALSCALIEGIRKAGADVVDLGVVSTPNVAFVTSKINANYGIVLSASHNPYNYNGIKIFNYDGRKLTNIEEIEIEKHIEKGEAIIGEEYGKLTQGEKYIESYFSDLYNLTGSLQGLKIVLDCSNGASSKFAPVLFEKLGAEVISYNTSEDGMIINKNCGALYPQFCAKKVVENNADLGLSFDGDADRLIAVDNAGNIVNGDSIIYIIGKYLKSKNMLNNNTVVGTYHTNIGVEKSLNDIGIKLARTDIGDHFVMEKMLRENLLVGGEQSGHIILREFSNTGDGVLTGLYLAKLIKIQNQSLQQLDDCTHYPQVNINVITQNKNEITESEALKSFVKQLEEQLIDSGRILLRASGTEPKVRIMTECRTLVLAREIAEKIENFIRQNFKL